MGVDGIGSPGIDKTLRSLRDALITLEREAEYALRFAGSGSSRALYDLAKTMLGSLSGETLYLVVRALTGMTAATASSGMGAMASMDRVRSMAESLLGVAAGGDSDRTSSGSRESGSEQSRGPESGIDLAGIISSLTSVLDPSALVAAVAKFIGLVDAESLQSVRTEVLVLMDELGRQRERELRVTGSLSQLKTQAAGFDEAVAGLARLQGRVVARLDAQERRGEEIEQMAGRRDDHITRLIRDTASQRSELERLAAKLAEAEKNAGNWEKRLSIVEVESDGSGQVKGLERQIDDLKRLQKSGIQSAIESLEKIRDRVGRLELRATEMSREARAKTGRLDALARHVASVEGKLTSAIGKSTEGVVAVAAGKIEDFESSDSTSHHAGSP